MVTTWLYTKAVLHSKSACGHHLALHQSSTPFQVSLWLSPGFTPKQYSIPSQLVIVTWLYTKAVLHSKSACGHHLALHQSSTPFQSACYCHLALHQSSTPFQVSLWLSPAWFYTKAVLHSKSACGHHLALHQSSTPFQVSLSFITWLYTKAVLSPPFQVSWLYTKAVITWHSNQSVIVTWLYTKAVFHSNQFVSPGFTPKQYSIPSQPAVITWLYIKAVLHSKSACGHHLALHKSSTPFQVSLRSSPGFAPKLYSIPSQLVIVIWLYSTAVLHSNLLIRSWVPFEAQCITRPHTDLFLSRLTRLVMLYANCTSVTTTSG